MSGKKKRNHGSSGKPKPEPEPRRNFGLHRRVTLGGVGGLLMLHVHAEMHWLHYAGLLQHVPFGVIGQLGVALFMIVGGVLIGILVDSKV